jgi:hypothetical protein
MSAPNCSWIRIEISGFRRCFEPSRCERKLTPSSSMWARASSAQPAGRPARGLPWPGKTPILPTPCSRAEPSEKAWKPPESVMTGRFQFMKLCRPPNSSTTSAPGRRYRW